MKPISYIFLTAIILIISACGNQPNSKGEYVIKKPGTEKEIRIKFFDNGNIDYIQEVANDQPEGFFMNFFKNGNIQNTSTIINGKKEGTGIIFHPDGSVKSIGVYKNDLQNGYFWLFDQDKNLVEKREYLAMNGKNALNQWIRIDENLQPLFLESNFVRLDAVKDTIISGETYTLKIVLEASFNKEYMAVIIGPYDESYQLPANAVCDTLVGINFMATYKTTDYKNGKNTVRGVVKDISFDKDANAGKAKNIYFTKGFYVKK